MIFEIDFNRETDESTLEEIGAKLVSTGADKYPPFEIYKIELNTFEELEQLLNKVNLIKGKFYSAVINFDPPAIFLDYNV